MKTQEIIDRLKGIMDIMTAKGLKDPEAKIEIHQTVDGPILTAWLYFWASGELRATYVTSYVGIIDALNKAEAMARSKEAPKREKQDAFLKNLGRLIDQGRNAGVDVAFLNPLEQSMRDLSENILTDQREG